MYSCGVFRALMNQGPTTGQHGSARALPRACSEYRPRQRWGATGSWASFIKLGWIQRAARALPRACSEYRRRQCPELNPKVGGGEAARCHIFRKSSGGEKVPSPLCGGGSGRGDTAPKNRCRSERISSREERLMPPPPKPPPARGGGNKG